MVRYKPLEHASEPKQQCSSLQIVLIVLNCSTFPFRAINCLRRCVCRCGLWTPSVTSLRNMSKLKFKVCILEHFYGGRSFMVSCSDECIKATQLENFIRLMCSWTYDNSFIKGKDIPLLQVVQPYNCLPGGYMNTARTILGYWDGMPKSDIERRLEALWKNDEELHILKDEELGFLQCVDDKFKRSKFCICPRGNSMCIAKSIYYGCIPVILADNFVLPFEEVLDWAKFSLILKEDQAHDLKKILKATVDTSHHLELQSNLKQVQIHFVWHTRPTCYDAYHMVLFDLWSTIRARSGSGT